MSANARHLLRLRSYVSGGEFRAEYRHLWDCRLRECAAYVIGWMA